MINDLSRRSVLAAIAATASEPLLSATSRAEVSPRGPSVCSNLSPPTTIAATPQRAISLRKVSDALTSGRSTVLEKLTRLDGYIVDRTNRDIILWGLDEPDQPSLFAEDFVVALRAAHGRYGVVRNGVNTITTPLISIDPVPEIFPRISAVNLRTSDGQEKFRQICATPQPVRIEGMPRNTRVAKTLVDADYRMKMVGQGAVSLPIRAGFPSHWEVRVQKWKEAVDRNRRVEGWHTRFWFQAGQFSHQASQDGDTVFLDRAQVILNDEDQSVSDSKLIASGRSDPITRAWVCAWSARMEDVYKAEPIWREMYNIFRHFAVARIMRDLGAIEQAGFDADVLLGGYEVPNVPLATSLPGLGRFEQYLPPGAGAGAQAATNFVCGGVAVGFARPVERTLMVAETANSARNVLASRPDVSQISWTINPGGRSVPPPTPSTNAPAPPPDVSRGRPSGIAGPNVRPL